MPSWQPPTTATTSNTPFFPKTFLPSSPKRSINSSPFPASLQNHTPRNSARCCHKSSLSSLMTKKMGYIISSVSYKTQQPTRQTTPPRSPGHARLPFTTRWYATIIRHRSTPESRQSTRPGAAIIRPVKPRSASLVNSSSAWLKIHGY